MPACNARMTAEEDVGIFRFEVARHTSCGGNNKQHNVIHAQQRREWERERVPRTTPFNARGNETEEGAHDW